MPRFSLLRGLRALSFVHSAAFLCTSVLWSASSLAVDPDQGAALPPLDDVLFTATQYPEGGLITGSFGCVSCTTLSLNFFDEAGNELVGTFLDVSDVRPDLGFVWEGSTPLTPGSYYAQMGTSFSSFPFLVVAEAPALPDLQVTLSSEVVGIGEPVICAEPNPASFSVVPALFEEVVTEGKLHVLPTGEANTQFSYFIEIDGGAEEQFLGSFYQTGLGSEARQVCYEVFGSPLRGGEPVSLGSECFDTSDIEDLGQTGSRLESLPFLLAHCTAPPVGFEDEWCEYHASAFAAHSCEAFDYNACVAARYACAEGDLPEYDHTLMPEATEDGSQDAEQLEKDAGGGGCSTSPLGGSGGAPATPVFLLLFGVGLADLRRRLRHP